MQWNRIVLYPLLALVVLGGGFEAGFANLTKSETTTLVHVGKGRTQQWTLVRNEQPAESK
jgi:hypothetical protein